MANVVLLFAGQGAQKVGMGKDLAEAHPAAAALFRRADEVLGRSLSSIMFEGPEEELTKTANCQPALFVHGLALLEVLKERLPGLTPVAAAGLSLGEMTAHTAAGTFTFEEGLKVVARRGELMDEACAKTNGAMAAMIGGEEAAVKQLAEDCGIDVANLNCPGQIVLSGTVEGVDKAVSLAKERGIRMGKKLNVAGAYHSRLMVSAEEQLGKVLAEAEVGTPGIPVVANQTATVVRTAAEIRETLTKQVTGSVRWVESMQLLRGEGHALFLELGPGKVLAGLMGRIDAEAKVVSAEDAESLEAAVAELG
ncbi:MAG: ACP S-malonyltransferase [Verrucomicrobia bacterium]|nr:ACP S-malonyltransferase [Verrucomicrobiota bacterium]MDA1005248.1 ACP S-malonyltransferase [Verrucomicrobiota bacterium]